jgi:hypothetical protein
MNNCTGLYRSKRLDLIEKLKRKAGRKSQISRTKYMTKFQLSNWLLPTAVLQKLGLSNKFKLQITIQILHKC